MPLQSPPTARPALSAGPPALAVAAVLALALVAHQGCRAGGVSEAGASGERGRVHVGIVFDIGGRDDRSFNAAAWEGARRAARRLPIVLRSAEPGDPSSMEPALRAFAERGYDLIIGVGFAQAPLVDQVAADYPRLDFAVVDGVSARANVASLVFKEHEGAYLVGMIAARTSRTRVLGFLGGMDIPLIHRFAVGFAEGAHAVDPAVTVLANYVGVTDAAWNDPGKAKELAVAQIGRGADVIFAAAGNSGIGAFDAAEQHGVYVIGVDSNQNWIKPGRVLTSMVKRVDNAVDQIVGERVRGRFRGGLHVYGLDNGGIGYAMDRYNRGLIPPAVIAEVEAARRQIIAGRIAVTDAMAR
jgi:basic membrane protein A